MPRILDAAIVLLLATFVIAQQQARTPAPATQPAVQVKVSTNTQQLAAQDLPAAQAGPAKGKRSDQLIPVATIEGQMLTGITVTHDGQIFVCFPRWGDPVNYTVGQIRDNQLIPFPDARTNQFTPQQPQQFDPKTHLVSVQSVVADQRGRLWLLDTGSINFAKPIPGAPKLLAYEPATGRLLKTIDFTQGNAIKDNTYLNDVRFALDDAGDGHAFITDSGAGGIIVVDLGSGQAWRKLDGHPSTMADTNIELKVEGQPLKRRPKDGPEQPMRIHADGIAISPDRSTLYYTPLTGRSVYAVPVANLLDREMPDQQVAQSVRKIAEKPSANDGIICDANGRIYTTDFEDQAIRVITPPSPTAGGGEAQVAGERAGAQPQILVQDERLLWPDTLSIGPAGDLFIAVNQLHRQPGLHKGQDQRVPPYVIFKVPL